MRLSWTVSMLWITAILAAPNLHPGRSIKREIPMPEEPTDEKEQVLEEKRVQMCLKCMRTLSSGLRLFNPEEEPSPALLATMCTKNLKTSFGKLLEHNAVAPDKPLVEQLKGLQDTWQCYPEDLFATVAQADNDWMSAFLPGFLATASTVAGTAALRAQDLAPLNEWISNLMADALTEWRSFSAAG